MIDFINKLNGYELIKLVGGLTFIISASISFIAAILHEFIQYRWKIKQERDIEIIKQEYSHNENILLQAFSSLSNITIRSSELKLEHYKKVWDAMIVLKQDYPILATLIYTTMTGNEIINLSKFIRNGNYKKELLIYDPNKYFLLLSTSMNEIEHSRIFLSSNAWNIYCLYHTFLGRLLYILNEGIKNHNMTYWLKDNFIQEIIPGLIKDRGKFNSLISNEVLAFSNILGYLELEYINDMSNIMSGNNMTKESVFNALDIRKGMGGIIFYVYQGGDTVGQQ
jgi:hypothetical protein